MRVLHVIGVYPPAAMSGPPEQVHRLARELRAADLDVRIVTTNSDGADTHPVRTGRWVEFDGVPVYYGRRVPGTGELSWGGWREVSRQAAEVDLIHATGMFSWINIAVAASARRLGVPVVVSPRGSLDPDALIFSPTKKAWFFRLGGFRALEEADVFHVTSAMERGHVEAFVPGAEVRIVPNGVIVPSDDDLARWTIAPSAKPMVLYLGRVHPKKNVIPMVRAWAAVAPRHPAAKLVIAGPDDHGHRAEVERVIESERLDASVSLVGRILGDEKSKLLARAACLILPSLTENFGNVVAEALAHRVPVIASTGTPWRGLHEHECGWWLPPTVDGLAAAMDAALTASPAVRAAMGERGRRWMIEEFSWPQVARGMSGLYADVVSRRQAPR